MREGSAPRALLRGIPITVWMLVLVVIPLGYTFLTSFFQVEGLQIAAKFTLKNYALFLIDPMYSGILLKSLMISLAIAILAILAGYPLAYMLCFRVRRGKQALFMLSIIPLWVSYLVRIIAWRTILGNKGVINSALTAVGLIQEPLEFLLRVKQKVMFGRPAISRAFIGHWLSVSLVGLQAAPYLLRYY